MNHQDGSPDREERAAPGGDVQHPDAPGSSGPGSEVLKPKSLPRPTYWPAALALGTTFILWGLVSSIYISFVGAGVFVLALTGWIREMRD